MSLRDTDKNHSQRSHPTLIQHDQVQQRMANATTSLTAVTDTSDGESLLSRDGAIKIGQDAFNSGVGLWLGVDEDGVAKLSLGDSASNAMTWDGTTLDITGAIIAGSGSIGGFLIGDDYLEDAADSFGLASTVTTDDDVRFWAGDTFANRATAPFRVTEAGAATAASIDITGGSITGSNMVSISAVNLASRGWVQSCAFSSSGTDTVTWGAGTFASANGDSFSIGSGTTGVMAARTYIYLDLNQSITAYQVTTTLASAVGDSKVLVGIAQNNSTGAVFSLLDATDRYIDASDIVANSITANQLSTSLLYAGSIQIDTSGSVRSGQTAFNTGTGWFIGTPGGVAKFSIGNPAGDNMTWDGSLFKATGSISISSVLNNATYLTAGLPIAPTTAGFSGPGGNE